MCGIAGTVGLPCDASIAADLLATMRRRGPDGQGTYFHPQCTLLHARLAIVDLAGGKQPMSLPWAQEAYTITYNGELYNTQEIRKELEYLGHHFRGHSDTEVLLHAYAQWGEACLERLNGIYAFAVWEEHAKRLFLARDRMGVKPLFYKGYICVVISNPFSLTPVWKQSWMPRALPRYCCLGREGFRAAVYSGIFTSWNLAGAAAFRTAN